MADTKTLEEWEKERGFLHVDPKVDLKQKFTEQEIIDLMATYDIKGVDHESRKEFLEENGYKVTRENMLNSELSAKSNEENE